LYEICEDLPVTKKQLSKINGMGKIRVQKYGEAILEIINDYCQKNSFTLKEDVVEQKKKKVGATQQVSLEMFKNGLTISEIAAKRGFVNGTIESHLAKFIISGEIEITDLIPEKKFHELKKIIENTNFESISELKHTIDDKYTYGEIRLVYNEIVNSKGSDKDRN
jgi:uncharacterized protein YpbB